MYKFLFCKLLLATTFFIAISFTNGTSQCAITDLIVNEGGCDDEDKFAVEINFNFDETGTSGFQVLGNGNNYGTFQYSELPILIEGLAGNCETEYEFIVRDVMDPTCAAFVEYGTVCCDDVCLIDIFDFETTECENNVFFGISLNLASAFTGEEGYSVDINGVSYGDYNYQDLPLSIDDIDSGIEGNNIITICDNEFPDCCDTYIFLNPCVCGMNNITTEIIECDSEDSTYYVIIDFDHVATNDSFQMGYPNNGVNTFLGNFAYADLPVTAGPIFLSEEEQEILIVDKENFFCFSAAYLGIVDDCNIECQIFNLFAEADICENGEYFIDIEFSAKDIQGNSFLVLVDGVEYGSFEYGESFYTIGPIPSNCETAPVVVVQDLASEFCSDFFNFSEPICCLPDCNFTDFEVTTDCSETMLTINGSFENNGTMLSGFYFVEFMGTSYGPYIYNDFMFSIDVPLLPNGEYQININDSLDPECQISTTFEAQCDDEPCMIFDVLAEPSECEDGQFFVDIEFNYAGDVSDSFEILGNGTNYGTFTYGEQFYTVGPLDGDCETIYEFLISDQIFEGCNSFYAFEQAICCSTCQISDIELSDIECENNLFYATLNFVHEETTDSFLIISAGNLDTALYLDLPLRVGPYVIGIAFEFTVIDFGGGCSDQDFILIEEEDCTVGIEEASFSKLNIVQSSNDIYVENNETAELKLRLYNMTGALINSMDIRPSMHNSFDTSLIPSGLYLLNISDQNSQKTVKLIVY